jgi:hypothetical protein
MRVSQRLAGVYPDEAMAWKAVKRFLVLGVHDRMRHHFHAFPVPVSPYLAFRVQDGRCNFGENPSTESVNVFGILRLVGGINVF